MGILGRMLVVAFASLLALPGAQARPRLFPGLILAPLAIVGGIAGAALGSRKARAHRHYHRPSARRDRGAVRQNRSAVRQTRKAPQLAPLAAPAAAVAALPAMTSPAMTSPEQSRAAQAGWAGPLFWPHAYDGVFEYALGLPGDNQFWGRGFGDVIDGMFTPPVRETTGRNSSVRTWENLCGSEAPKAAGATIERIRQTVQPSDAQRPALDELGAALMRATERIEGACPAQQAANPPERLHMMITRLTAMRQAVLTVQGPLRAFYDQLSDQQKSALERAGLDGEASNARADTNAKAGCAAPVANWPQAQIERVVQPTKPQRAYLEQLRQTSLGLAQFVASTCPAELPRTSLERLDAVKDRLAVLRYAASNVSPAFEQFYQSLNAQQKSRFQALTRERRAESGR